MCSLRQFFMTKAWMQSFYLTRSEFLVGVSSLVCELFNSYCPLQTQLSGQTCSPLDGRIIHLFTTTL